MRPLLLFFSHVQDQLLLADDPRLHFFVSLSLLMSNEKEIMKQDFVELPEFISKIVIDSRDHVKKLVRQVRLSASIVQK